MPVALLLTGGCASFNHEWAKAAGQPVAPGDIQGRWQGVWISDVNGHSDNLRCVITKKSDGLYSARFHAHYRKVMTFNYTVPLKIEPAGDGVKFTGDANLGWLAGGKYHYEGRADDARYTSSYSCKYDNGTFQMERPPEPIKPAQK